jgi:hypothetical protein
MTTDAHATKTGLTTMKKALLSSFLIGGLLVLTEAHATPKTNGNGAGPTDVGIWYCTYYGDAWNNTLVEAGYPPPQERPLCSNTPGDYRIYNSADVAVIDFHLQQMANAKIDFLLLELTCVGAGGFRGSGGKHIDNARVVAQRIKIWNEHHAWKIKYAVAAGAHWNNYGSTPICSFMEGEAHDIYDTFYNNPAYGGPDNYYQLNGKPLIVYYGDLGQMSAFDRYQGDKTYGNFFTVRYAMMVNSGTYGWNILSSGTVTNAEVEVVSPGWGGYIHTNNPSYVPRRQGDFYRQCWNTVLSNPKPTIVMIVSFNDYWEKTAVWITDTTKVTDVEKWSGPDGQLHPAMYWEMTINYIEALRSGGRVKAIDSIASRESDKK